MRYDFEGSRSTTTAPLCKLSIAAIPDCVYVVFSKLLRTKLGDNGHVKRGARRYKNVLCSRNITYLPVFMESICFNSSARV